MRAAVYMVIAMLLAAGAAGQIVVPLVSSGPDIRVSLLSQSPDPAEPGQTVELRWKAENYGSGNVERVLMEILPRYPFSLEPGVEARKDIGSLSARQKDNDAVTLFYRLRVDPLASPSDEKMTLRYSIDGGASWVTLEDFEVRIAGHTAVLSLESVSVTPERLEPGKPAELALRLRNNADVLLKNIRVNLQFRTVYQTTTAVQQTDLPFTAVGSSNEKELAQLTPGASGEVAFRIIVDGDASSGVYKVPIGLTYLDRDGNAYSVEETQIGLVVEAPVAYALALKDRDLYTSGNGEVVLSLSNVGPADINYLTLELLDGERYEVISARESYIGNLESDDFETAAFTIHAEGSEELQLQVRLRYRDSFNELHARDEVVPMPLYSTSAAKRLGLVQGGGSGWVLIVAALLGAGVWWLRRRKR
ncbi:COG1361 S-layer family protein [Candidatus Woesearchaeota archaeon]|nr:COG1361 S-layer family protein [Candidatus Woesearchaeota archaeon]